MNAVLRYLPHVARVLMGLFFFVFGLNGFLHFLPQPPLEGPAGAFAGALAATGYMFPLIKGTEVVAGALLLSNRFVPLALVLLAPVVVNIAAFHTFLTPPNGMAYFLLVANAYLGWAYRDAFRGMLGAKNSPAVPAAEPAAQPVASAAE